MGEIPQDTVMLAELINPPAIVIEAEYNEPDRVFPDFIIVDSQPVVTTPWIEYAITPGLGEDFEVGYRNSYQRAQYSQLQLDVLADVEALQAPIDVCMKAPDIADFIQNPHVFEFYDFTEEQLGLIEGARELIEYSDVGRILFQSTSHIINDTLICDYLDSDAYGSFDQGWNTININSEAIQTSSFVLGSVADMLDGRVDYDRLAVTFEEYAHAFQTNAAMQWTSLGVEPYSAKDQMLWSLGQEANAKLIVAIEAVRAHADGDSSFYDALIEADDSGVANMARSLMLDVEQIGIEAFSDRDALHRAFIEFFTDRDSMLAYFDPEYYRGVENTDRMPVEIFESTMGTVLTNRSIPNFLEGRYSSMDDVAAIIPEQFEMRKWLDSVDVNECLEKDNPFAEANNVGLDCD